MAVLIEQITDQQSRWNVIGFFDDGLDKNSQVDGLEILGNINDLNSYPDALSVCVAIADPATRFDLIKKITNYNIDFPVLVHPQANIGDIKRNKLGRGSIITAGTILTTGINIGEFSIINLASTVGHDVKLGSFCTLMPGCSISGSVSIGDLSIVGTGARIIQGINIGESCLIGAGAVVTKNFGNNLRIVGMPARGLRIL